MKAVKSTGRGGKAYGHVPGHDYLDADVKISRTRRGKWRVEILETWGSTRGFDLEHGSKKVIGYGDDLSDAISDAHDRAKKAGITTRGWAT